jgi:EmrB/QacA subfamily drug resistance transporter
MKSIENLKKNPWIIFCVTAIGIGMSSFDAGIVNVALPTITANFNTDIAYTQWIVSGYLLMICMLLPLFGKLSDMYPRKNIYLFGLIIFSISSMFCSLSLDIYQLILARIIQGIGAAMIMANNQALIVMSFPEAKRGAALGVNSTMVSLGLLIGPTLGGILVSYWSWKSIFYINIPLGIIGCCIGFLLLPYNHCGKKSSINVYNMACFFVGGSSLFLFFNNSSIWGWFSTKSNISLFVAILFLTIFAYFELKSKNPLIQFSLFRIKSFFWGNILSFSIYFIISGSSIILPFYLEKQLNLLPNQIGFILFIIPLCMVTVSPISGFFSDKYSIAKIVSAGMLIMCLGISIQFLILLYNTYYIIILSQTIIGIGYALFQAPNNSSILSEVPKSTLGISGSLSSFVRNMGKVFGTSITIVIFQITESVLKRSSSIKTAFQYTFVITMFVLALFLGLCIYINQYNKDQS